jgi:poly(A)-specific ribonuclease
LAEIEILYEQELGFTKVIEMIMKSKKPIIGHNMIMDIGFIYRQFISDKNELPKNYNEFAKLWRKEFPHPLYDTKVLAAHCGQNLFGKTGLDHIYERCRKEKKLNNNIVVEFDKERESLFGLYDNIKG